MSCMTRLMNISRTKEGSIVSWRGLLPVVCQDVQDLALITKDIFLQADTKAGQAPKEMTEHQKWIQENLDS